jgi:hypothetical protein
MITEKDFEQAISEYFDEGERTVPEYRGKSEAQVMFELAKKMAVSFAYWVVDHRLDFQAASPEGTFVGLDMKRITGNELLELYLNQK